MTQPNDKARLRPLVRVLVNMAVRLLADKMEFEQGRPKATYKHRLLGMMDEFPSLGKLDILQESLAFLAGYGIKFYLICPDECLRMPGPKKDASGGIREPGDMVVYVAGYPAIYGRQPLYFQDPVFQARSAVPAPNKSDRLTAATVQKPPVTITLDWRN